jgi:hypothetical protein
MLTSNELLQRPSFTNPTTSSCRRAGSSSSSIGGSCLRQVLPRLHLQHQRAAAYGWWLLLLLLLLLAPPAGLRWQHCPHEGREA